jgi:hypothetical protein
MEKFPVAYAENGRLDCSGEKVKVEIANDKASSLFDELLGIGWFLGAVEFTNPHHK